MRAAVTLLCAGLAGILCSCAHRAAALPPPQSVRVSKLCFDAAAYGKRCEDKTLFAPRRLRPTAGMAAGSRSTLKSWLAARRVTRSRAVFQPAFASRAECRKGNRSPEVIGITCGAPPLAEAAPVEPPEARPDDPWFSKPEGGEPGSPRQPEKTEAPGAGKTAEKEEKAPRAKRTTGSKDGAAEEPERKAGKPDGEFDHLPFGTPVPGKPGYVTLPRKYGDLPEIDVRGIAPGTAVEIPDPDAPGSTIQFRVP